MSWDNTAPSALSAASSPTSDAPGALSAASSPSNSAPTAIPAASSPSNSGPSAISAAASPSNTGPDALAAAVSGIPFAADTTDESADIETADAEEIEVGMTIRGPGIPEGATVTAIDGTTVTLSIAATATGADVALLAFRPPGALTASPAMGNVAPTAITAAASPSNTAPTALSAAAGMTGSGADALTAAAAPSNSAPSAISAASGGTGDSASALPASTSPTNQPPQFFIECLAAPTDNTVNTPTILIGGALVATVIHGFTRIVAASALTRVQVQLDDPPAGAPAVLQLVDGNGSNVGPQLTVAAGEKFTEYVIEDPEDYIGLSANTDLRVKCVSAGTTNAGGFGAVTLFLQLT